MDGLLFHVLFHSISVLSARWVDNYDRLCAMEPSLCLRKKSWHQARSKPGPLDQQASA